MIDQSHLQLLHELNTEKNPHSGGALLDHLQGTHGYLKTWGNDKAVCVSGLFHSIYGTQSYETESASLDDRQRIREVIGERAERLAFLFSMTIRAGFFEALGDGDAKLSNRATNEEIPVTQAELRDLIEMEVANYLEFMPRLEFTHDELDVFERKVERSRNQLTDSAYEATKPAIESKRQSISA